MADPPSILGRALDEIKRMTDAVIQENRALRRALDDLRSEADQNDKIGHMFEERYLEAEQQNGNLASLYIATYNLHSTLDFSELIRTLREIVVNLVGSESFGIYMRAADAEGGLELLAGEGIDPNAESRLRIEGVVLSALESRRVTFAEPQTPGSPLACVPLTIGDETYGAVVIHALLAHKKRFETTDVELLELVSQQASVAFYAARLHAENRTRLKDLFLLGANALAQAVGGNIG
jgi:GAF domain-containing protein